MTLLTMLKFLVGDRDSILRVARCPQALWIGLLFVLAAGFAREYDGEDLLHEPWHLLIPLAASLGSSAVLYLLVRVITAMADPPLAQGYRSFLSLYWLTAPLALLYAIPVERMLSAAGAVQANLWLLGLVAAWRVVLISRVVAVLYGATYVSALFVVMLFADTVAVVILMATPLPIVSIMGGIRLSESEQVLRSTVIMLRLVTIFSWPIWLIGVVSLAFRRKLGWTNQAEVKGGERHSVARHLWLIAAGALAVWAVVLPAPQREQRLRRQVEMDLRGGRIREALATMSAHDPTDFPPHWDPPPRIGYRETKPDIVTLREQLAAVRVAPWVRVVFDQKFRNFLRGESEQGRLADESPEELARQLAAIEQMSPQDRIEVIREQAWPLQWLVKDENYPVDVRDRVQKLLVEAGADEKPPAQETGEPSVESDSP